MPPPLSPRAQELLDAIERDVTARRTDPPAPAADPPAAAEIDHADLLDIVDALTAQAEQARLRLATLTAALREVEDRLEAGAAPEPRRRPQGLVATDLHHHLLPGIDDGPPTMEEAVAIARAAVAAGTSTVVATPHVSWDYPANTAESIAAAVAELKQALAAQGVPLRVLAGAEVAVTRAVDLPDEELRALRLGGGPYLLVECPFTPSAVGFEVLLESLLARGHLILLAHPERCPAFQQDGALLERLVARGVLTQVTAGSLSGGFGRTVREFAHQLVREGLTHVIASDAHSVDRRPPSVLAELDEEGYAAQAAWFADEMPQAILRGDPLPPMPEMPPRLRLGLKRLLGR